MDLSRVQKKLNEASFFLSKMVGQERLAFGERDPFDYYLSAFLNASRTIDYRLRHEQGTLYRPWRVKWNANLSPAEDALMKFLADDRAFEVHASGSRRDEAVESIKVTHTYSDDSGTVQVYGPPGAPPATIHKPSYWFTINGTQRKATEACTEYFRILEQMVAQFQSDNP